MKRSHIILPLILVICILLSGCQRKQSTDIHDSYSTALPVDADISGFHMDAFSTTSNNDSAFLSELDRFANAAGDTPPYYGANVDFSLANGVLTANGKTVPDNITALNLSHSDFPDYQFLENFTSLEELNLSSSSISDISVLSGLSNLKRLYLSNTAVLDLSDIKCLPRLWLLDVSGTTIDFNFQEWDCHNTLEVLYIFSTETSTLTGIESFSNLRELWCWDIPATSFSELGSLKNLESLNLSRTALEDITFLSGMTKLKTLDISTTSVHDFSLITKDNFPKLKTLSISVPKSQAADIVHKYPSLNVQNFYEEE